MLLMVIWNGKELATHKIRSCHFGLCCCDITCKDREVTVVSCLVRSANSKQLRCVRACEMQVQQKKQGMCGQANALR